MMAVLLIVMGGLLKFVVMGGLLKFDLILICPLLYFADFKYTVQSATKYFIKSVIFRSLEKEPDVAIFGGN
jgi:hypothetical protein